VDRRDDVERYDPGDAGRAASGDAEDAEEEAGTRDPDVPTQPGRDVPHVDTPGHEPRPRDVWARRHRDRP
jgi:hypothetical protein